MSDGSLYNDLRKRAGLSQGDAATLHGVSLDTIKSWCVGRRNPPHEDVTMVMEMAVKLAKETLVEAKIAKAAWR